MDDNSIKSVIQGWLSELGWGQHPSHSVWCFAVLVLDGYFEYQVGIKSQFIMVSLIPCVLTEEFLKAEVEFPKLLTVFGIRETRRSLNMFDYMLFVTAVFVSILYCFHSVMIKRNKKVSNLSHITC